MRRTDPLIIGGGPAGSAVAITLARGAARPLLIERSEAPHATVCGAFLGWDALKGLHALGVDPWSLGARPIDRVRIVAGNRVVERPLPHRAAGLSRRGLDEALLEAATAAGTEVRRGVVARRVDDQGVHLNDGSTLPAQALFLATGKHALRGLPREGVSAGARVGLRVSIAPQPGLAGVIELHLLQGGYAGLLEQEDGGVNLCLSIDAARLAQAGGSPDRLAASLAREAPRLADRVDRIEEAWSAVAAVPYGWRGTTTQPGCFRVGDQAAVIASLAGDGIAIALASGRAAATAWLEGGDAAAPGYQHAFAARAARPLRIAEMLRAGAERPAVAAPLLAIMHMPGALGLAARLTRIGH